MPTARGIPLIPWLVTVDCPFKESNFNWDLSDLAGVQLTSTYGRPHC